MDIKKMMSVLKFILPKLEQIDKQVEEIYENGRWYDLNEDERYIYLQLRDMQYKCITPLINDIKYTNKNVKTQGQLFKNELGRYEIEGYIEITSGCPIELYIKDDHKEEVFNWVSGSIEHSNRYGGYYFTSKPEISIDGVLARIK